MQRYKSSLKITSFDSQLSTNFIEKMSFFGAKKNYSCLKHKKTFIIKKKNTILRSPHVNKKARDQIEIRHISSLFEIKSNFGWLFFLFVLKKISKETVLLDYKHCYRQEILILPTTSSKSFWNKGFKKKSFF